MHVWDPVPYLPDLLVKSLVPDLDVLDQVPRQVDHGDNAMHSCKRGQES